VRIFPRRLAGTAFLAVLLAACARAPAPRPSPTSPIAFPLYRDSNVLSVRAWHRELTPGERAALGAGGSAGDAYSGYEVLTATTDSFDAIVAWLQGLNNVPPQGYRVALWGSGVDEARMNARAMGIDFAVFARRRRGSHRDVAVIAVDPDLVQQKAGIMLSVMHRYKELPAFLRSAVDAQAKAQTGLTVSEAIDPATPIGIAFNALERLHEAHARGIIFVDTRPAVAR
jgi:hypothetical protein